MGFISEFKEFLKDYKVVGVAVAFIMAAATTTLVQSLVNNLIMPIIGIFIPNGAWQSATVAIGSATIGWGSFLSALINFIVIALVIFLIVKFAIRNDKQKK